MFYHNAKYTFALSRGTPAEGQGGIIAASAMPEGQLRTRVQKRDFQKKYTHLGRRLFDPQLYLAGLDPHLAPTVVPDLASYPWFGVAGIPRFDAALHGKLKVWEDQYSRALLQGWSRMPPSGADAIAAAARSAVAFQLEIGCNGIILPTPLVSDLTRGYEEAILWLDAGLAACAERRVALPIYATVAIRDSLLQHWAVEQHPVLRAVGDQVSSREALAGAYLVVETMDEDVYSIESQDTVRGIFRLIDDLVRGAGLQVITNYMGTLGAVATAVGAEIWSSGYYLSQRRLKLSDLHKKPEGASAYPRYHSLVLAGDIGIATDLSAIREANLLEHVLTPTAVAEPLHEALRSGRAITAAGPEWQYARQNITAASAHYNTCAQRLGAELVAKCRAKKIDFVQQWLESAAKWATEVRGAKIENTRATEVNHQSVWLAVFKEWRSYSGL
jgi:hypothetical protein